MSIRHFNHGHTLKLKDQKGTFEGILCEICSEEILDNEVHFSCDPCLFFLHKTCKDFPRVLTHSFHPQHSLTLSYVKHGTFQRTQCSACRRYIENTYTYRCFDCYDFILDLKCVTLVPLDSSSSSSGNQISSHPHPLILCEPSTNFDFRCRGCSLSFDNGGFSSTPIYVCFTWGWLLHEPCANQPQNIINHPFHPQHSLLLTIYNWNQSEPQLGFRCFACHEYRYGLAFACSECPFKLDILCATVMQTNSEADDHVSLPINDLHPPHPHPLVNCQVGAKSFGDSRPCFACNLPLNDSISFCITCEILLHKSCTRLPQKIQHSSHPLHPLTLHDSVDEIRNNSSYPCKVCLEGCSPCFSYRCEPCDFKIEARCALQPIMYPMVKSELHEHPLVFSNSKPHRYRNLRVFQCRNCGDEFEDPFFHCQGCHFHLHAHCLSKSDLPPTLKHKCHVHPLSLTYSHIRDRPEEDETAELYCDACEERRRLRHPTYYCRECHFVSHVHCVIPEVISYMQEKKIAAVELDKQTGDDVYANAHESEVGHGDVDKGVAALTKQIAILSRTLNEVTDRRAHLIASKTRGKNPKQINVLREN